MPCEMSYYFYLFIRTTIVVLGSFLDTFQKIADAASNTKGNLYFTSNIPIAKGSVISRWDNSKICILLWFYDKLDQLRNRQKSYFLQNGCYHCLWLGSYILPFQSSTSCLRNKVSSCDPIFYSSYNNNPSIIFIFLFFFVVWGIQVYKYSNICLAETINLHP